MKEQKTFVMFSKAWLIFFVGFGIFVTLFGFYELSVFLIIMGAVFIVMGLFFRKMSKIPIPATKTCAFCISPMHEKATVCSKCTREQPQ